jgi:hypothetical protein
MSSLSREAYAGARKLTQRLSHICCLRAHALVLHSNPIRRIDLTDSYS